LGTRVAFSLAELILAIALVTIVLLTLVALSLTAMKSNRKATDSSTGQLVAEQRVDQLVYGMQSDTTAAIWGHNLPSAYSVDQVNVSNTDFTVAVYARDPDPALVTPNRLKRVEVVTSWWNAGSSNRAGIGELEARFVRIVREP